MRQNLKPGEIFETNNFGKIKVLQEAIIVPYSKLQDKYYQIQFMDSGYIRTASACAILSGRVKDNTVPNIANTGYIGADLKITTDPIIHMFYKSWNDMINRCYNSTDEDYPLYGAIGITVDKRWFNFSVFLIDVMTLPNYDKKIKYPNIYQLDKDYLQFNIPKSERIYSKSTCIWISKYDNILIMNRDYGTLTGYYGVLNKDNSYCARYGNTIYGRFDSPIIAASFYNIIYLKYFRNNKFNDICLLNNVPEFSPQEILEHCKNKQKWFINSSGEIELIL